MAKYGPTQQKILLLLLGGLTLGLNRSRRGYFKILKGIHSEWKEINHRSLMSSIQALYRSNLVSQHENRNGLITFILSKKGKQVALSYNLESMTIPKNKWDKKWRVVMFDIPEKLKKIRETLRYQLKRLGFLELQKSVFVLPYECEHELEYITEFYNIRKYVRVILADKIDNELDFKNKFSLI